MLGVKMILSKAHKTGMFLVSELLKFLASLLSTVSAQSEKFNLHSHKRKTKVQGKQLTSDDHFQYPVLQIQKVPIVKQINNQSKENPINFSTSEKEWREMSVFSVSVSLN